MTQATTVSTVWLEILRAQRPLRYAEITQMLPMLGHARRASALNMAYRMGYVERSGECRGYEYSVTPRCTVPAGVPLVDVLEATA